MFDWALIHHKLHNAHLDNKPYWNPNWKSGYSIVCAKSLNNLAQCLGAAAKEHYRLRYTTWVLFGWPLDGK